MSSQRRNGQGPESRTPLERVEAAMQEVADYRRDVLRMQQMNADMDEPTLRGFQAALMNYYMELDLYRDEQQLESFWKDAKLWRGETGDWVRGFDNLERWNNAQRSAPVKNPGLGRGQREVTMRSYMPPDVALRVSRQLDRAAKKLGLAIKVGVPVEDDPVPV